MPATTHILVDTPMPGVSRITLNRPEKRNAMNNALRTELFATLEANDLDPDVKLTIIRGAGPAFCSGYDLSADNTVDQPYHSSSAKLGQWSRHVVDGWFRIWDLAKPVIAQVHGYCLAGGTELATACDLVYVADDAQIGYPPVRVWGCPTTAMWVYRLGAEKAKRMLLTGDTIDGKTAKEWGLVIDAVPEAELDGAYAVRIAATVDAAGLRGDLRRHGILAGKAEETRGAERRIMLSVRGSFAGHHDYLAFRDMISGIPGVQSATPASIAPRLSEWHLRSSEGAQGIARELSKRRFKGATLRIVQSGEDAIVVSLDSKGGNRD